MEATDGEKALQPMYTVVILSYQAAASLAVAMTLVCAFGLVGNLVIMVAMPRAKLAKKTRILLCSLAFADFLSLLTNGIIKIALPNLYILLDGYVFGLNLINDQWCTAIEYFIDVSEVASQCMMAILAAERCYVVYFPLRAANLTTRTTTVAVLLGYFVCLACTIPQIWYYGVTADRSACLAIKSDMYVMDMYMLLRHLLVEHVLFNSFVAVCNVLIFNALSRRQRKQSEMVRTDDKADKKSNLKVTVALVVSSSCHILLIIPCGILCYLQYYYFNSPLLYAMTLGVDFSYTVYAAAHCINFVLYMVTIKAFRKAALCKSTGKAYSLHVTQSMPTDS